MAITFDHIIPKARGGSAEASNFRLVHYDCNQNKGNLLDEELFGEVKG